MAFLPSILPITQRTPPKQPRSKCASKAPSPKMTQTPPRFAPGVTNLENEGAYAVQEAANALESQTGRSVIHLEIGQPGLPTPPHIAQAGIDAIQNGMTKYTSPAGTGSLRKAIAKHVSAERGVDVTKDMVVVGPGAKPGLFFVTMALVRGAEDEVVIPDPGFPTYRAMVEVAGGSCVPVGLRDDMAGFDMREFESKVSERTRIVVLNSPGNPTGGVIADGDLERIAELAVRYDFWVISDEIYSQLVYSEGYGSIFSKRGMRDRTVVVDGFSKSYCMTGWRLGWAVMPVELAERLELLMVHSVGCTAAFVQEAGLAAIEGSREGVVEMREVYRKRRDFVVEGLNAIQGVECVVPDGAFYAFADVKSFGMPCREIARLLLEDGFVAVLPGTDFGDGGEGYVRLSYVSELDVLREGLVRMKKTLDGIRQRVPRGTE